MRTSLSFKSEASSSAPYVFGVDSLWGNFITIMGRWTYQDFRSKSPSYYLSKIEELSWICLSTSDERNSIFFIEKIKNKVNKKYINEIGAYVRITENNLLFLSNSLRDKSVVEIGLEIENTKENDDELIAAIASYTDKGKSIKFEEKIVEYYVKSTSF